MNWLAHIHVKDKYIIDDTKLAEGEGRLVLRVLCVPDMYLSPCLCIHYIRTWFMYSVCWYLVYVFSMLVLFHCIQYVGTWFMYSVCWYIFTELLYLAPNENFHILINNHQDLHMMYFILT